MAVSDPEIRSTLLHVQTKHIVDGLSVPEPIKIVAAIAIVGNPWFGRPFTDNFHPEVQTHGPAISSLLTDLILDATGESPEGYGKAAVVGMGGKLQHARALTHSLWFADQYRDAFSAKAYLEFSVLRGAAGTPLVIPLMDKYDFGRQSHYQTINMQVPGSPADDEMILALCASVGGQPHDREGARVHEATELESVAESQDDLWP